MNTLLINGLDIREYMMQYMGNYINNNTMIKNRENRNNIKLMHQYLEYINKVRLNIKHKIYFSEEFNKNIKKLAKHELEAINTIEEKLKSGKGIYEYLSKDARLGKYDGLFNDWNILHCHLCNKKSSKKHLQGLNCRTGNILFIFFLENKAFFIDIGKHGKDGDPDLWYRKTLLEIIYRNWKELLLIHDQESGLEDSIDECDIKKARRLGINRLIDIYPYGEKIMITPMFGGLTMAKTTIRRLVELDKLKENLSNKINALIKENGIIRTYEFKYYYPNIYILITFFNEKRFLINMDILVYVIQLFSIIKYKKQIIK